MPVADVVGVPALVGRRVVASLALRVRRAGLVVPVEVGEVAVAVLGRLVVALLGVVVVLVVARCRVLEELQPTPRLLERSFESETTLTS